MKRILPSFLLALILIASQPLIVPAQGQETVSVLIEDLILLATPPMTVLINGLVVNATADMDIVEVIENVGTDRRSPINKIDIDWHVLADDYNPPSIGGLLVAIKDSNITTDGSIDITYNIKRQFNQMGEDYRFFFMPEVAWYDFESIGAAISYMLFTWTGEFGTFPEKAPQYQAEARLRKIFAAPNNEYPQIDHQPYRKWVMYDGAAYTPWPESYNSNTMLYDLIELKERQEREYTYYTATANEYGFDVNAYYEAGENEKFLFAKSKAMGLDYNAALEKLLENGDIIHAKKSQTYIIEFRIQDNNTIPMIVSVDKHY